MCAVLCISGYTSKRVYLGYAQVHTYHGTPTEHLQVLHMWNTSFLTSREVCNICALGAQVVLHGYIPPCGKTVYSTYMPRGLCIAYLAHGDKYVYWCVTRSTPVVWCVHTPYILCMYYVEATYIHMWDVAHHLPTHASRDVMCVMTHNNNT